MVRNNAGGAVKKAFRREIVEGNFQGRDIYGTWQDLSRYHGYKKLTMFPMTSYFLTRRSMNIRSTFDLPQGLAKVGKHGPSWDQNTPGHNIFIALLKKNTPYL